MTACARSSASWVSPVARAARAGRASRASRGSWTAGDRAVQLPLLALLARSARAAWAAGLAQLAEDLAQAVMDFLEGRRVLVERQFTERGEALDGLVHAGVAGALGSRPGPF